MKLIDYASEGFILMVKSALQGETLAIVFLTFSTLSLLGAMAQFGFTIYLFLERKIEL